MPRMTKAQHAKHDRLTANLGKARDVIYSVMHPRRDVPFCDCYDASPQNAKAAYDNCRADLETFESQMVAECRAYRGTFGRFISY